MGYDLVRERDTGISDLVLVILLWDYSCVERKIIVGRMGYEGA